MGKVNSQSNYVKICRDIVLVMLIKSYHGTKFQKWIVSKIRSLEVLIFMLYRRFSMIRYSLYCDKVIGIQNPSKYIISKIASEWHLEWNNAHQVANMRPMYQRSTLPSYYIVLLIAPSVEKGVVATCVAVHGSVSL